MTRWVDGRFTRFSGLRLRWTQLLCGAVLTVGMLGFWMSSSLADADSATAKKSAAKAKQKAAPAKAKKAKLQMGRAARHRAILRGLDWMDIYIQKHWNSLKHNAALALAEMMSANDPVIQKRVLAISKHLVPRLKAYFLSEDGIEDNDDLFDAIEFLSYAKVLRFKPEPLLSHVKKWLKKYSDPEKLFGHQLKDLSKLNDDQIYELLVNTYLLERTAITFNDKAFLQKFRMFDIMKYIRTWKYLDLAKDKDPDKVKSDMDAYLATHVAYALNNYGHLFLKASDIPLVEPYMRRNFRTVMKMKDVELIAEFVDVWRSMGLNEANDAMVKEGTKFLLLAQKKDGSWGDWEKHKIPYDAFHYSWTVVLGLRDRTYKKNTKFDILRTKMIRRLNKLDAERAAKKKAAKKKATKKAAANTKAIVKKAAPTARPAPRK